MKGEKRMLKVDILGLVVSINTTYVTIGCVMGFFIYMLCFYRRNPGAEFKQYFYASKNFLALCLVAIFLAAGYFLAVVLVKNEQYAGLIIPLGWCIICFINVKRIIAKDFGVRLVTTSNIDWNRWGLAGIQLGLGICSLIATIIIFSVVPDREHQSYGTFLVIIAGIIFLLVTIIIFINMYKTLTGKMHIVRMAGKYFFTSRSNAEPLELDMNNDESINTIEKGEQRNKVFFIVWSVFACLFASIFIYIYLLDKGIIR